MPLCYRGSHVPVTRTGGALQLPQGFPDQRPTEAPIGPSHQNCCVCDLHFIIFSEIRGKAASRPGSPCSS
jgi:hypothetical protein